MDSPIRAWSLLVPCSLWCMQWTNLEWWTMLQEGSWGHTWEIEQFYCGFVFLFSLYLDFVTILLWWCFSCQLFETGREQTNVLLQHSWSRSAMPPSWVGCLQLLAPAPTYWSMDFWKNKVRLRNQFLFEVMFFLYRLSPLSTEWTGYKPFSFFEPGILSLPMGVISFILIISLGPLVLPDNKGGLFREVREHGDNLVTALDITQAPCQHLWPDYREIISN